MSAKRKPKKKEPTKEEIDRAGVKAKGQVNVQAIIPAWRQQQMDNLRATSQRPPQ